MLWFNLLEADPCMLLEDVIGGDAKILIFQQWPTLQASGAGESFLWNLAAKCSNAETTFGVGMPPSSVAAQGATTALMKCAAAWKCSIAHRD